MNINDLGASADAETGSRASTEPQKGLGPPGFDPARIAVAKCIEIVRRVHDDFLSPEFATDQPLGSFSERFACDQVANAIEQEFGMGTIEQCHLLGKPTPFEVHGAASGTLTEGGDAKLAPGEGTAK